MYKININEILEPALHVGNKKRLLKNITEHIVGDSGSLTKSVMAAHTS